MRSAEVPPSDANDSGPQSEDQQSGSVLDFLYHDARRVGSFLAQFETYGVPSQVKATESAGRSETTRTTAVGDFGIPAVAKAQGSVDASESEDERDTAERTYDPLWTNARTLLDYLAERDLIQRDLWSASIGQFVLAKGVLLVLDVGMLEAAWEKPTIKRLIKLGARGSATPPTRPTKGKGGGKAQDSQTSDADLLVELLTVLPHSLQAHLVGDNYSAWCGLATSSLVGMSSDLVLKHGSFVPGVWHMLGILDAVPDLVPDSDIDARGLGPLDAAMVDAAGTVVGALAAQLATVAR
jgi:hypothetical protein